MTDHDKLVALYHESLHNARSQEQVWIAEDLRGNPNLSHVALGESAAFFQLYKQLGEEGYG